MSDLLSPLLQMGFDLPEVELTRAQAVYVGTMLARAPRLEVVGG